MSMKKYKKSYCTNIPALRVVLTSQCNLNCEYCPPKGENFVNTEKSLETEKLLKILKIFYEIGFRQFGFTGGEPLLKKDLPIILKACSKFKGKYFKLYTNGTLFKEKINILEEFDLVKLSLDTINRKKYEEITGRDNLKDILEGIELAKKNKIKIRINTVLTQKNCDDILNLIEFCYNKQLDLKILDLNCFDVPGYSMWKTLYKSPLKIVNFLERKGSIKKIIYTTGNYGIAMPEFRLNGISIRIKDTKKGSVYSPICINCRYFLCQEGLYQITLTSDGKLKMCRHRSDISIDLNHKKTDLDIKNSITRFVQDHYFLTKRLYLKKQVFLGQFGIGKNAAKK